MRATMLARANVAKPVARAWAANPPPNSSPPSAEQASPRHAPGQLRVGQLDEPGRERPDRGQDGDGPDADPELVDDGQEDERQQDGEGVVDRVRRRTAAASDRFGTDLHGPHGADRVRHPLGGPMPTVLIVDDEQHIRLLIEQTLEELEDEGVELHHRARRRGRPGRGGQPASRPRLPRRDDAQARRPRRVPDDQGRSGDGGHDRDAADGQGPGLRSRAGSRGRRRRLPDQAVRPRRPAARGPARPLGLG